MVYVLGLHLALRGRDEHQNSRHFPSQLSVKSYDGRRYLEYTEDVRLGGGLHNACQKQKKTQAFELFECP